VGVVDGLDKVTTHLALVVLAVVEQVHQMELQLQV
jgi:hypothetical protein